MTPPQVVSSREKTAPHPAPADMRQPGQRRARSSGQPRPPGGALL